MKRIVTSFSLIIFCISFLTFKVSAQTPAVLYYQNFDSSIHPILPSGWSATGNGWTTDTTSGNASVGVSADGTYSGASGANNVVISNATGFSGTYELVTNNISTKGYASINVDWGARLSKHFEDSGSAIAGFYWSSDNGGTWNQVSYAENANTSLWTIDDGGAPIVLPVGAENQATLKFKWVATLSSTSSGTYRIDDFTVGGVSSPTTGIKPINTAEAGKSLGNVVVSNKSINIYSNSAANEKINVQVFNVLGNVVKNTIMSSSKLMLNTSGLSSGVYFVRLSTSTTSEVNKVVLN